MANPQTFGAVLRLLATIAGPSLLSRRKRLSTEQRLAQLPTRDLPLSRPVDIRWNDHQIPFLEAETDRDLAVGLGMVHAHLRLAQIDIMRRLATGTLSEAVGAAALPVDYGMRVLGFPKAVPEIENRLPEETRIWLEGFADGINAVIAHAPDRPEEFRLLDLRPRPWTVADLLSIGRLAASDFTWKVWQRLIRLAKRADWQSVWQRLVDESATAVPSFAGSGGAGPGGFDAEALVDRFGRSGSNALAVSAARSMTGAALLASDPHLGIMLPNPWIVAGFRSPSYHAVGMMLPGLPVVGLGRNMRIGWGGTSLHAGSSDLVEVGDLPSDEIETREETIPVRWGKPATVTVRETTHGPIITDIPRFAGAGRGPLSLRWIGHRPNDEITALLRLARATGWEGFLDALEGFAAPAQNMIYADTDGRVGIAMAAHLPQRPLSPPVDLTVPPQTAVHWEQLVTTRGLPHAIDPPDGIVASANNRPETAPAVPVGFFFSADERVERIRSVLNAKTAISVADLVALQQDVRMPSAPGLARRLAALAQEGLAGDEAAASKAGPVIDTLRGWDGAHTPESVGALAFELMVFYFLDALHGTTDMEVFKATWDPWALLHRDLDTLPHKRLADAAAQACPRAAAKLSRFGSWGGMHRLKLDHPFGVAPVIGRRYRFVDEPVGGSNETVMKTAHGFSDERHSTRLGALARHISDFSDADRNWFVLLGGQDGWLGSETFLDQFALWRRGEYVQVPLRPESARSRFRHHVRLLPREPAAAPKQAAD